MPLPQMLKIMMVAKAIIASSQFVDALDTAEPARIKPIQIIIGPVTTGGKKRITFFTPTKRMTKASTRYKRPATTIPPQAQASFSAFVIEANSPSFIPAIVAKPPKNAKEEPKKAGTFILEHTWNNRVPNPAQNRVTATVRPRVGPSPQASTK